MSMPSGEINTRHLLKHALSCGKQVFIPYIYKPQNPHTNDLPASIMDMLQLSSEEDRASLKADKWGIPSISKTSVSDRVNCLGGKGLTNGESLETEAPGLDVIVMPSMAFDQEMNRLGHGKGYYDNFITRYCSAMNEQGEVRKKPFLGMSFCFSMCSKPTGFSRLMLVWCSGIRSRRTIASSSLSSADRALGLES